MRINAELCVANFCVGAKQKTKFEKVTDFAWSIFDYARITLEELILIRATLIANTILVTFLAALLLYTIKGRHRTCKKSSETDNTEENTARSTAVKTQVCVNNTMRLEPSPPALSRDYHHAIMKGPQEFTPKVNLEIWLMQLESFLAKCTNKQDWFDITISYIHPNILSVLPNLVRMRELKDNFDELKRALIEKYGAKKNDEADLLDFATRKQRPNEKAREYGDELIKMAKSVFKNVPLEGIDEHIKSSFAKGLFNEELRSAAIEKIYKTKLKKEDEKNFSGEDLIEYVCAKEAGIKSKNSTEHRNSSDVTSDFSSDQKPSRYNLRTFPRTPPSSHHQRFSNSNFSPPTHNYMPQSHHQAQPRFPHPYDRFQHQKHYPNFNNHTVQQPTTNVSEQVVNRTQPSTNGANNSVAFLDYDNNVQKQNDINITGIAIFNNSLIEYFCDGGAVRTIISLSTFEKIKKEAPETKLERYAGRPLKSANKVLEIVGITRLNRCLMSADFELESPTAIVVKDLDSFECILGRNWQLRIPKIRSSMQQIETTVKEMSASIRTKLKEIPIILKAEQDGKYFALSVTEKIEYETCDNIILSGRVKSDDNYSSEDQILVVDEFSDTESYNLRQKLETELGKCSVSSLKELTPWQNLDSAFKIEFIDAEQKPISCKSRPLPFHLKNKVKLAIQDQLDAKIIRPSKSPWASALRVVHKPDFSIRITVDYKPLNKVIKIDRYPLPSVSDLYAKLSNARYFSKIDMKSAYHQIPMHPDSIEYTAFICEFGLFEYLSMPMGISSAPSWFQRFINTTLEYFINRNVLNAYLDDIILYTANLEDHDRIAHEVIETLRIRNIKTSIEKSELVTKR